MKRDERLRKGSEFDSVFEKGIAVGGPLLVVRHLPNSVGHPRWGFAVGKKIAKRSTERNRMRRLLREAARATGMRASSDVIVTARRDALTADLVELQGALERGLRKAGISTE